MWNSLLAFVVRNDVWMLALLAVAGAWYLLQIVLRQQELQRSAFLLERERASADRNNAFLFLALCLVLAGGIVLINRYIAPHIDPALVRAPTPQPDLMATAMAEESVARLTPRREVPTATPPIVPTATLRNPGALPGNSSPTPTIVPLDVEPLMEGCGADVMISQPATGSTVSGMLSLFGRARGNNFSYYTIEVRGAFAEEGWISLLDGVVASPVENGFLGSADVSNWPDGIYAIRLTTTGSAAQEMGSCLIQIGIRGQGGP
jgi:hypothetical protein